MEEIQDHGSVARGAICHGCGAPLQTEDEHLPGYIPRDTPLREPVICRRCFRIRHYGEFPAVEVSLEEQEQAVLRLKSEPGLVMYVIDGFDIQGSLIEGLRLYAEDHPLLLVVNKTDVFPKEVKLQRLGDWIENLVSRAGVSPQGVVFVSAKSGSGLDQVVEWMETSPLNRVFVLGRANVGKSTLLNRLLKGFSTQEPFTTSRVPGTTLGLTEAHLTLPSGKEVQLADVPGLIQAGRLTDLLCPDCLRTVLPQARLRPRIFQLNPGQSLWIGGYARLDFEAGDPQSIVCYVSNDVVIHRTKIERAVDFGREHMDDILQSPCAECRRQLGELRPTAIRAGRTTGAAKLQQGTLCFSHPTDIVLPGLGWLALSGISLGATLWAPAVLEVQTRPRLLGVLSRASEGRALNRGGKSRR